jgi:hypothetical protein
MYTTSDDRGILNNYASEPGMYYAGSPSTEQKRQYALQGAIATLLVAATVLVSLAVS